jgi:predicted transcriptional regulator
VRRDKINPPSAAAYMTSPVVTVAPDTPLPEVDRLIQSESLSALVVSSESGGPAGVVSRSDLVRQAASSSSREHWTLALPDGLTAAEVMTDELVTADAATPLDQVARTMAKKRIHRVFVTRRGELAGVIATKDVMRAVVRAELSARLGEVMTDSLLYVRPEEEMSVVVSRLAAAHVHGLLVMQDDWPTGIVTGSEVLVAQHWPSTTAVEDWMSSCLLTLPENMYLYRAAAGALALDVRHVVVMDDKGCSGLVTGIDFARAYAKAAASG